MSPRSLPNPAYYSNQIDRLFAALSESSWNRIGAIVHAPAPYLREPIGEMLLDKFQHALGRKAVAALHFDAKFDEASLQGLPCWYAATTKPQLLDAVVLLSPAFSEVLFHFFNTSPLRRLPLFAPFLAGSPHRMFLRHQVLEFLKIRSPAHVLEIGGIQHMNGGHRTTQAFAEALWLDGTITSIDRLPLSLELSRFYCRGLPTPLTTILGDLRELLDDPPAALLERKFEIILIHYASDNGDDQTLAPFYEQLKPFLAEDAWVVFQSLHEPSPRVGSLQEHLLTAGYDLHSMQIENATDATRFLVVARPGNDLLSESRRQPLLERV